MKKKFTVLLCVMCLLALVLAGCNNSNNVTDTPGNPTTPDGRKIVTIGMPQSTLVTDYDTNSYTVWLEETTGYEIKFIYYAYGSADYQKQLSTEAGANQKLPDILWRFNLNDDMIERYGEEGIFVDLSAYFEDREKSANYWHMVEKYLSQEEQDKAWLLMHSDYRESLGTGDTASGPIYAFPTMETTLIDTMDFMPMINKEWLDVLKLDAPTNLQQLKDVLIAFKERDPNGNGIPDEKPMLGSTNTLGGGMIEWIINFFIYYDDSNYFNLDENGQLYMPQKHNQYREALKYLRDLVKEDLLNVNTLTYDYKKLSNVLQNQDIVGVTVNHPSLVFTADSKAISRWEALDLYGFAYDNRNAFKRDVFITDSCQDVDAAWDVLMHMCTEESTYRLRYGEPGVDWDYADAGATSVMGIPATIKVYNDIWNTTNNRSWMQLAGGVYPYSENEQNQVTGQESDFMKHKYQLYKDLRANFDEAKKTVNTDLVCPLLRFNEEEDEIAKTRSDVKKAVTTWRAYFMDGTKDINSEADWNEYLQALDTAGAKDYQNAAQMCYERMYKSVS